VNAARHYSQIGIQGQSLPASFAIFNLAILQEHTDGRRNGKLWHPSKRAGNLLPLQAT